VQNKPTTHQTIGLATLRRNPAPLEGYGAAPVQLRLARGPVAPLGEVLSRSRLGRPLEQGPVSIESQAHPRANFRLARGHHGPAASIPAPLAGAFNALTSAGAQVKGDSTPLRAWESCPGTASPTPVARPSPPLCDAVRHGQQQLVALCHPPPYGRHAAPSRKDGGALEGKVNSYTTPVQGHCRDARLAGSVTSVAIGPVRPSPPSPTPSRSLHRHPRRCRNVRRRDATTPTAVPSYDLASAAPSSPHTGGRQTGDCNTATLEAAPGHVQDTP
jgi:hypothetical protein